MLFFAKRDSIRRSDTLLRRRMQCQRGRYSLGQLTDAQILHNQRIDSRSIGGLNQERNFFQFVIKDKRIQGDVDFDARFVTELYRPRQIVADVKIGRSRSGRKGGQAQKDGIGAIPHGRP